ncbi:prepilin peptidase [Actinokineospora cianjurensis]|uniref:Leader peptidase (Prepilin peptidase)/N-methyltransferase n=1 Tax=Actinokineospora cianjurensis TaxID=585224 RepID=A0A421BC18_9PSEU|nr:prepilin peptidase [Actinokineospora cianjurensis]RLK61909.1 leader peptidase (prepilin peptidase)/N-methyltransferase [Actinokineospora cianjurensis]
MDSWIFIGVWALVGTLSATPANALVRSLALPTSSSVDYRLVMACGSVTYALLAARLGMGATLVAYSVLASLIIPLAAIDIREHRLPTKPIIAAAAAITILFAAATVLSRQPEPLIRGVICSAVCLVLLTIAYLISPGFIGGGDIRLAALLVLALGWTSWSAAIRAIVIGLFIGALHGASCLIGRRSSERRDVPLGPALAAGALFSILIV